jgi:hypothetical protein
MLVDDMNKEIRKLQALSILLESADMLPEGVTEIMDDIVLRLNNISNQIGSNENLN